MPRRSFLKNGGFVLCDGGFEFGKAILSIFTISCNAYELNTSKTKSFRHLKLKCNIWR